MTVINGEALTPDAARVMRRLCRHWSHKFAVRFDDHTGEIQINDVKVAMRVAPAMRARAQIIAPGTMITSQPLLPAPIPIQFPYPPYATRVAEVLGSPDDDAQANALLEDM